MNIEDAILLLTHTSKDDFNLEEYQAQGRIEAIQVLLNKIEELKVINAIQEYRIEVIDTREFISKDKIKAILEEYKYTEIGDSEKIIEFYKKMQLLLEKE